jgi:hypothetical protein
MPPTATVGTIKRAGGVDGSRFLSNASSKSSVPLSMLDGGMLDGGREEDVAFSARGKYCGRGEAVGSVVGYGRWLVERVRLEPLVEGMLALLVEPFMEASFSMSIEAAVAGRVV